MVLWQSGYCGVLLILFFRGSIPFGTLIINLYKRKSINEHVEIGKQSPLKQEWNLFLKSSSLFVRIYSFSMIVFPEAN